MVEVAASSASIDLRHKRRACCRNGVREYPVWLVAEARREWLCLEDDDYRPQLPDAQGVLHSRVFPGLRLPVSPLLASDTAKVMVALAGHEPLNRKPPETSVNSEHLPDPIQPPVNPDYYFPGLPLSLSPPFLWEVPAVVAPREKGRLGLGS